ncbi:uncharacterized protein LOC110038617 [Phalaenopsis equestris]|uniref:uncharacterized protein LOC110038617 n=1 Tax=Phalaenopsis equestris TaxID=78828 RepID=UPI0009E1B44D|nr:uncharacterized protein LOC110038617 [Phalaenopsis equestris]
MEGLTACCIGVRLPLRIHPHSSQTCFFSRRRPCRRLLVFASREGPEFDKWEQMELKFGRLLGEDPKLTLAKIMARKDNPHVSYLDVEKSFRKNKGKMDDITDMPADLLVGEDLTSPGSRKTQNLPKNSKLNLSRPVMNKVMKPSMLEKVTSFAEIQEKQSPGNVDKKTSTSNVTLRKPSVFHDDDIEAVSSKLKIKPNLYFKLRRNPTQYSGEFTLLKKPEVVQLPSKPFEESVTYDNSVDMSFLNSEVMDTEDSFDDVETKVVMQQNSNDKSANYDIKAVRVDESGSSNFRQKSSELDGGLLIGLQPPMQEGVPQIDDQLCSTSLHGDSNSHKIDVSVNASLLEKPNRQEYSDREGLHTAGLETARSNDKNYSCSADVVKFQSADEEGSQDHDWKRMEKMLKLGERAEVELISCSSRGFVASVGSLIGFLPYRNLGTKWKFLAFESWLRKKGLDPSLYKQNLSIMGNYVGQSENPALDSCQILEKEIVSLPDMKFEGLLKTYEQEKMKYLSSFVGQRLRVSVIHADRSLSRLIFSGRPKENEELVKKKRMLMARLNVGDIVKCCVKKITYFGIFVEVEGVPALIHQSEISWDFILDPSAFVTIGQVLDAKVHQLDFVFQRITLSLKDVTPDPLIKSLEFVVDGGTRTYSSENRESAQPDFEWPEVDLLIKKLQGVDGVNDVTKGRFFLSPGLAPTFQVYMASMFDNQFKLLARYENKVQEIMVQASLNKEQLKDAILTCTDGVQ